MRNRCAEMFRDRRGFTLAELLIVVAVIAVLAMISIPIFRTKLEAAREETDIANLRSAKAAAVAQLLANEKLTGAALDSTDYVCYYDAAQGVLTDKKPATGYGQGTEIDGGCDSFDLIVGDDTASTAKQYKSTTDVTDSYISVTMNISGKITLEWVKG